MCVDGIDNGPLSAELTELARPPWVSVRIRANIYSLTTSKSLAVLGTFVVPYHHHGKSRSRWLAPRKDRPQRRRVVFQLTHAFLNPSSAEHFHDSFWGWCEGSFWEDVRVLCEFNMFTKNPI